MTITFSISVDHVDVEQFRELARQTRKTQKELFGEAVEMLKGQYREEGRNENV